MKINQIIVETSTTAGVVATVSKPLGGVQTRSEVRGIKPINNLSNKKGPYANSLTEGAVKQLTMDLKELKDEEFKKKYNMTKQEARKELSAKPEPIKEAELSEDDIILVPGQGRKSKTGFVPHGKSRVDHEVEMARSDLYSASQNAEKIHNMIKHVGEDEGLEGWVQEKIIKANDYLNTVREYLEGKQVQEMMGGVIAGGAQYESQSVTEAGGAKQYSAFKREWVAKHGSGAKVPGYDSKEYTSYCYRQNDKKQGVAEDTDIGAIQALTDETLTKYLKAFKTRYGAGDDSKAVKDAIIALRNEAKRRDSAGSVEGVAEGAKVDRMVKHVAQSEKKLGHSKKEAENIAWATANKRGMLDNKNKKKVK